MNRIFQFVLLVLATCLAANGADLAVLRNGNTIRHEKREIVGSVTRLYLTTSGGGYIEIPSDQILRFEKDTAPPPVVTSTASVQNAVRPAPQRQEPLSRNALNQVVADAGSRNQIDPDFINSVIRAESGFHQNAVSKKGAQGLMQLMPGTASQLGVSNPFDPAANVQGGTKYLRDLLVKYNYDVNKALAAYNAGPNRVDQYHGIPPYYETRAYITRIIRDFNRQKIAKNPALANKANATARRTASKPKTSTPASSAQPKIADAKYVQQQRTSQ